MIDHPDEFDAALKKRTKTIERRVDIEIGELTFSAVTGVEPIGAGSPSVSGISPRHDTLDAWTRKTTTAARSVEFRNDGWATGLHVRRGLSKRWIRVYKGTPDMDPQTWVCDYVGRISNVKTRDDGSVEVDTVPLTAIMEDGVVQGYWEHMHPLAVLASILTRSGLPGVTPGVSQPEVSPIFAAPLVFDLESIVSHCLDDDIAHWLVTRKGVEDTLPFNGEITDPVSAADLFWGLLQLTGGTVRLQPDGRYGFIRYDREAEPARVIRREDIASCQIVSSGDVINRYEIGFGSGKKITKGYYSIETGLSSVREQPVTPVKIDDCAWCYISEHIPSQEFHAPRGDSRGIFVVREDTEWARAQAQFLMTDEALQNEQVYESLSEMGFTGCADPVDEVTGLPGVPTPTEGPWRLSEGRRAVLLADDGEVYTSAICAPNIRVIERKTGQVHDQELPESYLVITDYGSIIEVTPEIEGLRQFWILWTYIVRTDERTGSGDKELHHVADVTLLDHRARYVLERWGYGHTQVEISCSIDYCDLQIGDVVTAEHTNFFMLGKSGLDSTVKLEVLDIEEDDQGEEAGIRLTLGVMRLDDEPIELTPDAVLRDPSRRQTAGQTPGGGERPARRWRDATMEERDRYLAVTGYDLLDVTDQTVRIGLGYVDGEGSRSQRHPPQDLVLQPQTHTYLFADIVTGAIVIATDINVSPYPDVPAGTTPLWRFTTDLTAVTDQIDLRREGRMAFGGVISLPPQRYTASGTYHADMRGQSVGAFDFVLETGIEVPEDASAVATVTTTAKIQGADETETWVQRIAYANATVTSSTTEFTENVGAPGLTIPAPGLQLGFVTVSIFGTTGLTIDWTCSVEVVVSNPNGG